MVDTLEPVNSTCITTQRRVLDCTGLVPGMIYEFFTS